MTTGLPALLLHDLLQDLLQDLPPDLFVEGKDIGLATGPRSDMTGEREDVLDHHYPTAGQ